MKGPEFYNGRGQAEPLTACFRCGICCTVYQPQLSLAEGHHIAGGMGITLDEFRSGYTDKSWPGMDNFLLRKHDGACVFLEFAEGGKITSCRIHHLRPSSCRDWKPGLQRRECQSGLTRYWGLTVSASGQIEGPAQKLREFHLMLQAIST